MEVYALSAYRTLFPALVRALADAGNASEMEVQTNIGDGRSLLEECCDRTRVEALLFEEGLETDLSHPEVTFRRRGARDAGPGGEWVIEEGGRVLGAGGWLTHYNPPYADVYIEVVDGDRRRGLGSYLVQEVRRKCSEQGYRVAARCDPKNEGSRRALERGGMAPCGEILAGTLREARGGSRSGLAAES